MNRAHRRIVASMVFVIVLGDGIDVRASDDCCCVDDQTDILDADDVNSESVGFGLRNEYSNAPIDPPKTTGGDSCPAPPQQHEESHEEPGELTIDDVMTEVRILGAVHLSLAPSPLAGFGRLPLKWRRACGQAILSARLR